MERDYSKSTVVDLRLDDSEGFAAVTHLGMPSGNQLTVVTKDDSTDGPLVVLGFDTWLPDAEHPTPVQFGMRVSQFLQIAAALKGRYGE